VEDESAGMGRRAAQEATMKAKSHAEMSFSRMLFAWATHRTAQASAATRPAYRADQVAAAVAASGNPQGV
jgi:hypothetical protein